MPEARNPDEVDKRRMRAAFDRAAGHYDRVAVLQREVGDRLLERLDIMHLAPREVLDAGSGTGLIAEALARRYPRARITGLDISMAMIRAARRRSPRLERWRGRRSFICADVERLPLVDACVDLIVSNLTLQWCNDVDRAFSELRRVLRPNGLLAFTSFGPDTLKELRASWAKVDGDSHVNTFIDMHDIGDALMRAGFSGPVMEREDMRLTYDDVPALMRDLKALGAHNATQGRPRGLTSPRRLARMVEAYESHRADGRIPATYEVLYGHCWVEPAPLGPHGPGGEVRIPLAGIGRAGDRR
jgi:malonyl-CoA O-methyltransferase